MISFKAISQLARKLQTSEVNVAREYLQHLFLRSFYKQKTSEDFLFKGGTALRAVYESPRFSEDLDFSGLARGCDGFEKALEEALIEIEREGIDVELIESKETTGGCLAIFSGKIAELSLNVQLEVSLRKKGETRPNSVLIKSQLLPPYTVLLLPEETLVTEKIQAVMSRSKSRDFFDLYFLLRSHLRFDKSQLPGKEEILEVIEERLVDRDIEKEVKPLLPRSYWPILKNFKENLKREVERVF